MDIHAMMDEAKDFNRPGRGYIHAEIKEGGEIKIFITGNAAALTYGIGVLCDAIAKTAGTIPETIIEAVKKSLHITKNNRDEEDPGIYKEI